MWAQSTEQYFLSVRLKLLYPGMKLANSNENSHPIKFYRHASYTKGSDLISFAILYKRSFLVYTRASLNAVFVVSYRSTNTRLLKNRWVLMQQLPYHWLSVSLQSRKRCSQPTQLTKLLCMKSCKFVLATFQTDVQAEIFEGRLIWKKIPILEIIFIVIFGSTEYAVHVHLRQPAKKIDTRRYHPDVSTKTFTGEPILTKHQEECK